MKIVIIEDEHYTAKDLENCIRELRSDYQIIKILPSVKEAISYFSKNQNYDLVFSDIQLGDGLSFEIYKQIQLSAPVIFCTAYDNYAIEAFKANGIDYILKPINKSSIEQAIEKYERLVKPPLEINEEIQKLLASFQPKQTEKIASSILVHHKDKIIPVKIEDIALFYTDNEITKMIGFDNKHFSMNDSLEKIESLAGEKFFRANRQYLINRKAVVELIQHFGRKHILTLSIPFSEQIIISKEKTPVILKWLKEF